MKKCLAIALALALMLVGSVLAESGSQEKKAIPFRVKGSGTQETVTQQVTVDDVLDALNNQTCRDTYDALLAGATVGKGSKGAVARGVQQTLVDFGQDIAVDGSVGPKTIAALNAVQAAFGLETTDVLDAEGYAELMPPLLMLIDADTAESLLRPGMSANEFDYLRACACEARGRYALAEYWFTSSEWEDWEARALACEQPWPKTGVVYKNPSVSGSSTELCVVFNESDDTAAYIKVYTTDGTLARTMFISGGSRATTKLPAGTYIVKEGTGKHWFGDEDSFGPKGLYEVMTFEDDEQELELMRNYRTTITLNVEDLDPNADDVGAEIETWNDF